MRPETFTVHCDHEGCKATMVHTIPDCKGDVIQFTDHWTAQRLMVERGWYYDARVDLCPEHFPRPEPEEEPDVEEEPETQPVFVGGAFHEAKR